VTLTAKAFPKLGAAEARDAFASGDDTGWSEIHRRHGDSVWLPNGMLLTIDRALVEVVLTERAHTDPRPHYYRLAARIVPGSDGLLFLANPIWERKLRAVAPVFQRGHLDAVSRAVAGTVRAHTDDWIRAGTVPDLYIAMTHLGADVALRAMFGIDPSSSPGRQIAAVLARYKLLTMRSDRGHRLDRADSTQLSLVYQGVPLLKDLLRLGRDVRELDTALAHLDEGAIDAGCVPALRGVAPDRSAFVSWINHLFGAYNAVDYTLAAALVVLERHPELRAALRDEVDAKATLAPSAEVFASMPRLHDFAREVFRTAPVANLSVRQLATDVELGGVRLRRGTQIAIGVRALHHDPRSWREPDRFDPSRWSPETPPHPPFAYVPFLLGPRRCWGRPLAEMVFAQVMREVLGRLELTVLDPDVRWTEYYMPRFTRPARAKVARRAALA
jgi:cytochrome P450